ncbi:MAG TPA: phage antirepressor N-terminal domain-containing protein [Paludibacteraceae bacterium]|nr:phage antirepressor N-terminal domain-containing protein [Paludibacteraceae bacterium]
METTALVMFSQTVKYQGNDIWIKPFCDFFGISYKWQVEVLKKDHILASMVRKNCNETLFGDKRERVLLPKKGFVRWIQLINPKTVREELQEKFKQFQELVFDYLYGSAEDEEQIKVHYNRMQKLERLYSKIGTEIKREKAIVATLLNGRYTQLSLNFNTEHQLTDGR